MFFISSCTFYFLKDLTPFEKALNQSKKKTEDFVSYVQKHISYANGAVDWKLIGNKNDSFKINLKKNTCRKSNFYLFIYKYKIEDMNWNYENNKLGFLDNQNYLNLNLNIDQLNVDPILETSLNQSLQKTSELHTFSEERKNVDPKDMNKKLINNYWELA